MRRKGIVQNNEILEKSIKSFRTNEDGSFQLSIVPDPENGSIIHVTRTIQGEFLTYDFEYMGASERELRRHLAAIAIARKWMKQKGLY